VVAIVALLATIAIPHLIRSRMVANETKVISQLRTLANALAMYRFASNAYPNQWQAQMYTNANPHFGPEMFNVDMQAADFTQQGYRYRYGDPTGLPTPILTYSIVARPVTLNLTGTRTLWVNETNEIYHCLGDSSSMTVPANAQAIAEGPGSCP